MIAQSLSNHPFPTTLILQAQPIKLLILDVDGVFTDGSLHYNAQGEVLKTFNALDGHGLVLLRQANITLAVISGRSSDALKQRLVELDIQHCFLGVRDKIEKAQSLISKLQLSWQQTAVIGDDWPDLPLLTRACFSCAPPSAHSEVLKRVHWVTKAQAGKGCIRECCDVLLLASGHYAKFLNPLIQ